MARAELLQLEQGRAYSGSIQADYVPAALTLRLGPDGTYPVTITQSLSGCELGSNKFGDKPLSDLIGPVSGGYTTWVPTGDGTMVITLDLDLGALHRLGGLQLRAHESQEPNEVAVFVSADDSASPAMWTEVLPSEPYSAADQTDNRVGGHARWVHLDHQMARHVRIVLTGAASDSVSLCGVAVYPSRFAEEPPTVANGYPINWAIGVEEVDRSGHWVSVGDIRDPVWPGGLWRGRVRPENESWEDDDVVIYSLGRPVRVIGLWLGFQDRLTDTPGYRDYWQNGLTIEGSDDYDPESPESATWTVLVDTDEPFGTEHGQINLADSPGTWTHLRVTNKFGAYPSGSVDSNGASLEGKSGTGRGALASLSIVGYDPAADPPAPIATVTLGRRSGLNVLLRDPETGITHGEPVEFARDIPPGTYPIYWDGRQARGHWRINPHTEDVSPGTYELIVTATPATNRPVSLTDGSGGCFGDQPPEAGEPTHYNPRRGVILAFTPTDEMFIVSSVAEEGDPLFHFGADFTHHANNPGSREAMAGTVDDDFVYAFRESYQLPDQQFLYRLGLTADNFTINGRDDELLETDFDASIPDHPTLRETWDRRYVREMCVQRTGNWGVVAEWRSDKVWTFAKGDFSDAAARRAYPALELPDPAGCTIDPTDDGKVWVAHSGDTITRYDIDPDTGALTPDGTEITGVDGVCALTSANIDGTPLLLATVCGNPDYDPVGTGQEAHWTWRIWEWDLSGDIPVRSGSAIDGIGHDYYSGGYHDGEQFVAGASPIAWVQPERIALSRAGHLVVSDGSRNLIVRLDRATGQCTGRMLREFGPTSRPIRGTDDGQSILVTGATKRVYQIRYDGGTYSIAEGGFGLMTSRIHREILPVGANAALWSKQSTYDPLYAFDAALPNGVVRRCYVCLRQWGVQDRVWTLLIDETDLPGGRVRWAASGGRDWLGDDGRGTPIKDDNWYWHDADGSGVWTPETAVRLGADRGPISSKTSSFPSWGDDGKLWIAGAYLHFIEGSPYEGDLSWLQSLAYVEPEWVQVDGSGPDSADARYSPKYDLTAAIGVRKKDIQDLAGNPLHFRVVRPGPDLGSVVVECYTSNASTSNAAAYEAIQIRVSDGEILGRCRLRGREPGHGTWNTDCASDGKVLDTCVPYAGSVVSSLIRDPANGGRVIAMAGGYPSRIRQSWTDNGHGGSIHRAGNNYMVLHENNSAGYSIGWLIEGADKAETKTALLEWSGVEGHSGSQTIALTFSGAPGPGRGSGSSRPGRGRRTRRRTPRWWQEWMGRDPFGLPPVREDPVPDTPEVPDFAEVP